MFKISRRIWIITNVSSEGVRRHTKPKTMDNYDLLSITIFEKCYSLAFARLISGNSVRCEAAFTIFLFVQPSFTVYKAFSVRSPCVQRSFIVHKSFSVRSPFTKRSPFTCHIIFRNFNEKGLIVIVRKRKKNVYVKVEGK
jgi:hypothetical protein